MSKKKKAAEKKCKFTIKKKDGNWHGEIRKDEVHNHIVDGNVKSKVVAKLRRVAKELGWKVAWK